MRALRSQAPTAKRSAVGSGPAGADAGRTHEPHEAAALAPNVHRLPVARLNELNNVPGSYS